MKTINKITTEAVEKATGKGWDKWIKILDKKGAEKLTHKEIARLLFDEGYIKRQKGWPASRSFNVGWWCQMVTVGYEYAKGRRSLGETKDQGYEIGVQRTIPMKVNKLWDLVTSEKGVKIWLGTISNFKLEPKFSFTTKEGTTGEIRTVKKGERIRLTYKPKNFKSQATVQLYFLAKGDKTSLGFHTEKLENAKMRQEMKTHWEKVAQEILRFATVD